MLTTLTYATMEENGETYELVPAFIERTTLGFEDHGVFTGVLHLDYGSSRQGAGMMILDSRESDEDSTRRGTAFGLDWIIRVIQVVGVDAWEELRGKQIYAMKSERYGYVEGIANIQMPVHRHLVFRNHSEEFAQKWPEGR